MTPRPRQPPWRLRAFLGLVAALAAAADLAATARRARRGPWRVEIQEGSMAPALMPGDWLLVDPRPRRWPPPGAIVLALEPDSDVLVAKRVAAVAGDTVRAPWGEPITMQPGEAWLLGDAAERSVDSRRYGALPADRLVAVVRWRYGPARRFGPVASRIDVVPAGRPGTAITTRAPPGRRTGGTSGRGSSR